MDHTEPKEPSFFLFLLGSIMTAVGVIVFLYLTATNWDYLQWTAELTLSTIVLSIGIILLVRDRLLMKKIQKEVIKAAKPF